MGCAKKAFIILVVWRWHQLLSDSLPNGRLSCVSGRLGRKLFRPPSYILLRIRNSSSGELHCFHSNFPKNNYWEMWSNFTSENIIIIPSTIAGHSLTAYCHPHVHFPQKEVNDHPVIFGVTWGQHVKFLSYCWLYKVNSPNNIYPNFSWCWVDTDLI